VIDEDQVLTPAELILVLTNELNALCRYDSDKPLLWLYQPLASEGRGSERESIGDLYVYEVDADTYGDSDHGITTRQDVTFSDAVSGAIFDLREHYGISQEARYDHATATWIED
jgi:hypothetical protein